MAHPVYERATLMIIQGNEKKNYNMKVKKIVYILIGSIILVYLLFCTGVPKSELYGIYTNDYKNHRDTIWLYPEGKGEQKIYDKNNLLVYSYKFEWTYKYAIPRSWATITINGITVPYDVDYTDSLYLPAEQFRFEPMYYSGLQFDKRNDTIMLLTENLPNVEYNQYFHKISEISTR